MASDSTLRHCHAFFAKGATCFALMLWAAWQAQCEFGDFASLQALQDESEPFAKIVRSRCGASRVCLELGNPLWRLRASKRSRCGAARRACRRRPLQRSRVEARTHPDLPPKCESRVHKLWLDVKSSNCVKSNMCLVASTRANLQTLLG